MSELHGRASRCSAPRSSKADTRPQPERIKGESQGATSSYTASSDVWSLGLSIIEFAIGSYPYPPVRLPLLFENSTTLTNPLRKQETYSNVFAQLTAIVHGDPPCLPDRYSSDAREFVANTLEKVAHLRPTYAQLLVRPSFLSFVRS